MLALFGAIFRGITRALSAIATAVARAAVAVARFAMRVGAKVIGGIVRATVATVKFVVRGVLGAVKWGSRQVAMRAGGYSPKWDLFLNRQINWRRALLGQKEMDEERDRLARELEDKDRNGIPDLYDSQVTSPAQDFLGIKYPKELLRENDYVRYLPRELGALPQPVVVGSKGLVRSETLSNIGQHVWVKWNALNPPGRADAPLYRCNAMDLHLLGHVYGGGQLTR